ncbi:MAG: transcriptional regulator [Burkholderia sp.]|nr:transcriptional regulator [Burkholderia sp.]
MGQETARLRWGVEKRLEFIEFRLFWEGGVNRSDITEFFGVSVPQASKDLAQYQELAAANIRYDRRQKRYFASDKFAPVFLRPDADRYLSQLRSIADQVLEPDETWLSRVPSFDAMPTPHRRVDPFILRSIVDAIRHQKAVEIRYQSLTRDEAMWRWITPHAFGSDGFRWHVRAFCHIDRTFKDFLLPRFWEVRGEGPMLIEPSADYVWNETAMVVITPHPKLSAEQRKVVALDFGMEGDSISIPVRLALLYYFIKRLNLDDRAEQRAPREQHVVVANRAEVKAALARASAQIPVAA